MSDLSATQRLARRTVDEPEFAKKFASVMAGLGVTAAVVGIVAGLVWAAHRITVACPDGHFTPVDGDPNCYSYSHLGDGLSLALVSLILLVLIVLVSIAVVVVVASRRPRG